MSMEKILVVDDEPQMRRVMRTTLTAQGYEAVDARSGEEALLKFEAERFAYTGEDLNPIRASPWRGFENRSKQSKIAEVQASDKDEAFRVLPSRPSAHFHKFT